MVELNHHSVPDWPPEGLEPVTNCPACNSVNYTILYKDLKDRLFEAPGIWTIFLCNDCKSGFLNPRPNSESIKLAYLNYETHKSPETIQSNKKGGISHLLKSGYLSHKYGYAYEASSRIGFYAMYLVPPPLRYEWDSYARHLPEAKFGNMKLLDVGCGNGSFLMRAKSQGWDVSGIDFDEAAVDQARNAGLNVIQGEIKPDMFPEKHFDYITCSQVIEHVAEPNLLLKSIYRWLKPGGTFWLATPNFDSDLRKQFGRHWYPLQPPTHLNIFSADALLSIVKSNGFSNSRVVPRGYNEVHYHRISTRIKNTDELLLGDDLFKNRNEVINFFSRALLELKCWISPRRGSDLVIICKR